MFTLPAKKVQDIIFDALSLTNDGVAIFDTNDTVIYCNDTVIYCNDSMASLFGSTAQQALNRTFSELVRQCFNGTAGINIESDNVEQWLETANHKRRSVPFRSFEVDTQDGRWHLVTEQLVNGNIIYLNCIDITEKKTNRNTITSINQRATYTRINR